MQFCRWECTNQKVKKKSWCQQTTKHGLKKNLIYKKCLSNFIHIFTHSIHGNFTQRPVHLLTGHQFLVKVLQLLLYTVLLLTMRNMYVYKNIRLYFYFRRWYLCGAEKELQRVRAHEGAVGRWKSQWTTDFSWNSGTYIV